MSLSAALIILAVCGAAAVLVCAPFILLARWRLKSRAAPVDSAASRTVPLRELPALAAYVCVMFYGFAHAYIAPDTWFGKQMTTDLGRLAFLVTPVMVIVIVRSAWREFILARKSRSATDAEPPSADA